MVEYYHAGVCSPPTRQVGLATLVGQSGAIDSHGIAGCDQVYCRSKRARRRAEGSAMLSNFVSTSFR
jgi:hypothetical protein